jgi:transposase-like protein
MCKASQDLNVHPSQLRDWVKKLSEDPQHAFPGHGHRPFGIAGARHELPLRVRAPQRGVRCMGSLLPIMFAL